MSGVINAMKEIQQYKGIGLWWDWGDIFLSNGLSEELHEVRSKLFEVEGNGAPSKKQSLHRPWQGNESGI
jgi:hypothetical protein